MDTQPRFNSLITLEELYLEDNGIYEIHNFSFANLTNLLILDFEDNSIEVLTTNMLRGLTSLKDLILWDNDIYEIETDCFRDLGSLEFLDLDGNDLEVVTRFMFKGLVSLRELEIDENPIYSGKVAIPKNNHVKVFVGSILTPTWDLGSI